MWHFSHLDCLPHKPRQSFWSQSHWEHNLQSCDMSHPERPVKKQLWQRVQLSQQHSLTSASATSHCHAALLLHSLYGKDCATFSWLSACKMASLESSQYFNMREAIWFPDNYNSIKYAIPALDKSDLIFVEILFYFWVTSKFYYKLQFTWYAFSFHLF